ncbi:hypothetical protein D1872_274110 [compost metagenome]
MKNTVTTGTRLTMDMANIAPQLEADSLSRNIFKAIETVYFSGEFRYKTGPSKSSQRQ